MIHIQKGFPFCSDYVLHSIYFQPKHAHKIISEDDYFICLVIFAFSLSMNAVANKRDRNPENLYAHDNRNVRNCKNVCW